MKMSSVATPQNFAPAKIPALGYSTFMFHLSPALPLTFDNVYEAVKGVKSWRDLGHRLSLDEIQHEHSFDDLCVKVVVEKFLRGESHRYPHPSWRAVIQTLDRMNETDLADKILDYGKPVQGECIMVMYIVYGLELGIAFKH